MERRNSRQTWASRMFNDGVLVASGYVARPKHWFLFDGGWRRVLLVVDVDRQMSGRGMNRITFRRAEHGKTD